jgi:hypothetical protein
MKPELVNKRIPDYTRPEAGCPTPIIESKLKLRGLTDSSSLLTSLETPGTGLKESITTEQAQRRSCSFPEAYQVKLVTRRPYGGPPQFPRDSRDWTQAQGANNNYRASAES